TAPAPLLGVVPVVVVVFCAGVRLSEASGGAGGAAGVTCLAGGGTGEGGPPGDFGPRATRTFVVLGGAGGGGAAAALARGGGGAVPGGPAQAGNPLITITSPAAAMAPPARLRRSIPKPPRRELRGIRSGRGPAPRSMSAGCPVPPGVGHVRGAPPAYGLP